MMLRRSILNSAAATRGFTLVELIGTMAVVGVVAAITAPIVLTASQSFVSSAAQRRAADQAAAALDRLGRLLREAPAKAAPPGAVDFKSASATGFALAGGVEAALTGSDLTLSAPGVEPSPLCRGVTMFQITYLDASGTPIDVSSGADGARRMIIRLAAQGVELSTTVWLRASLNES